MSDRSQDDVMREVFVDLGCCLAGVKDLKDYFDGFQVLISPVVKNNLGVILDTLMNIDHNLSKLESRRISRRVRRQKR